MHDIQPDHIEISTTNMDCAHCGRSFLDYVFDDKRDVKFAACPDCGWTDLTPEAEADYAEEEWFQARYL